MKAFNHFAPMAITAADPGWVHVDADTGRMACVSAVCGCWTWIVCPPNDGPLLAGGRSYRMTRDDACQAALDAIRRLKAKDQGDVRVTPPVDMGRKGDNGIPRLPSQEQA